MWDERLTSAQANRVDIKGGRAAPNAKRRWTNGGGTLLPELSGWQQRLISFGGELHEPLTKLDW